MTQRIEAKKNRVFSMWLEHGGCENEDDGDDVAADDDGAVENEIEFKQKSPTWDFNSEFTIVPVKCWNSRKFKQTRL